MSLLILILVGLAVVFVSTELRVAQQHGDAWEWAKAAHAKFAWVRKIRW